jgi:hypothetical protein
MRFRRPLVHLLALSTLLMPGAAFSQNPQPQTRPAPGGNQGNRPPQGGGNRPSPGNPGGGNRPSPGNPGNGGNRPGPGNGGNRPNPGGGNNRPNPGNGNNRPQPGRPNPGNRPPNRPSPGRPPQWGRPPANRPSYQFGNSRSYLRRYYGRNLGYINRANRPRFTIGGFFPFAFIPFLTPVPVTIYGQVPPPPPGYAMGYYDGYVVVYDPATYFIADVVDLLE